MVTSPSISGVRHAGQAAPTVAATAKKIGGAAGGDEAATGLQTKLQTNIRSLNVTRRDGLRQCLAEFRVRQSLPSSTGTAWDDSLQTRKPLCAYAYRGFKSHPSATDPRGSGVEPFSTLPF